MEFSRRLSVLRKKVAQRLDSDFLALAFAWKCNRVATARALAELEESGGYLRLGFRSMAEYGESLGLPVDETEMLTAVGRALRLRPALREQILTGKVLLEEAAAWGRADGASSCRTSSRARSPPGTSARQPDIHGFHTG